MEMINNPDELVEAISAHKNSQGLVYMRRLLEIQIEKYRDRLEREQDREAVIGLQHRLKENRDLLRYISE